MAINIASGFYVGASLSIDERFVLTKTQMKDMNENLIPDVYFCVCSDNGKLYIYNKNNTVDENLGKYRVLEGENTSSIQKEVLPTANTDELNNIYQYIGEDTTDYINGYFYKCIQDESNNYIWKNINVQDSANGVKFNEWEANKDYKKDEYVVKDYKLYKANTDSNLADFDETKFDLIIGNKLQISKQTDDNYNHTITLEDGTTQDLACDKIIQTTGEETIEIIIAKEDSSDGVISNGDIISINKTIKGQEIYSYKYNEEIVDPFA